MQYTTLGKAGVQVSRLCFGTMSFGGDADESTSAHMFHRCKAGIIRRHDQHGLQQIVQPKDLPCLHA